MSESKGNFEKNLKELETVVKSLENSDVSLDEMLSLFEKGVRLTGECSKALENAEQKITKLMAGSGGELEEVPFTAEG